MAQDFGDDMGNALLNFVTRQTENYLRFGRGRERAFDWWQRHYKKEGNTPEAAKAMAENCNSDTLGSRIPFSPRRSPRSASATMLSPISRVPVVSSFRFPPIRLSVRSRISSVPKSVI